MKSNVCLLCSGNSLPSLLFPPYLHPSHICASSKNSEIRFLPPSHLQFPPITTFHSAAAYFAYCDCTPIYSVEQHTLHCTLCSALHCDCTPVHSLEKQLDTLHCTAHTLHTCIVQLYTAIGYHFTLQCNHCSALHYFCTDTQKVCTAQNCTKLQ